MATTVFRPTSCVWQGSSTSTTGGDVILNVVATAGKLNFRDKYANGTLGVPLELYDATTGVQEYSYGTIVYGASAALDKITSRVITYSSNGPGTPVAWGAGTRNAFCGTAPESWLHAENYGTEMTDVQASNFLTRLGVVFGTAPGDTVQAIVGGLPVIGGTNLTSLPQDLISALIVPGLTGGAASRICRSTGAFTVTEATATGATNTADQLSWLVAKGSDSVYYRRGVVPFAGILAGNRYFLGAAGVPTVTRVTVDGVNSIVDLGYCRVNNILDFDPQRPITERLSTGAGLFLDAGNIAVP